MSTSASFYDRIAALASRALRVPIAFVTFVEAEKQVFKGRCFSDTPLDGVTETPLSHSICQYVSGSQKVLILPDTKSDPTFFSHLAVTDLNVAAYAGVPIFDADGVAVGAMCAIDHVPRKWTNDDIELLLALAAQVSTDIGLVANAAKLERQVSALQQLEETRSTFNRADRHDLRTPIQAMMLGVQAITQLGDLNDDQREYISLVERNAEELLAMVDKMLDVGRIDAHGNNALSRNVVDPAELIARAVDQVAPLAKEKHIRLSKESDSNLLVAVDLDKMARVLVNLLSNAIKFTPNHGTVSVRAKVVADEDAQNVHFAVSDTGIGIAPHHLSAIFAEGFMVDKEAKTRRSTGLGLTFCKKVVEAHGGEIRLKSTLGVGSEFSFQLPLVDSAIS